jgi:bloom syndrome protein
VDLTRDDSEEDPISHSSNGIEDSASRAEPPTRSSRKRKSGEISAGSPMRTEIERQPAKAKRIEHQSLDGFVDIDDMVPRRSQADRPTPEISRPQSVRPSIEDPIVEHDMEEEYPITETISKVETRTRKSISRVPSMSDATSSTPKLALPVKLPESQKKIDAPGTPTKYRPVVQVAASPIRSPNPRHDKSPSSESVSTQKRQKRRLVRTIEDSEDDDDDIFSKVEKKASCSPRTSVKNTPQVIDTSKPAKWSEIPEFESHDLKFKDAKDTKPRVGSPLRPISRNVAVRQDSLLSPFQKDSPTRLSHASKPSRQQSSQSTPTSTLGADEKKLAIYYLAQPSSISTYCQRVMNLLNQNSVASMSYMDEGEVAPKHLMEERKVLLDMKKAYAGLEDLAERYRTMMTEKKNLARKIYELLDKDGDTSVQEERQSALSQDLRRIEKEIGQLLHASGAIKDGFGTGSDSDAAVRAQAGSSKAYEGSAPLPSGSSTIGSAQIIMQTQFPSLQQKSTPSSNLLAEVPPKTSPSRKLVSNSVSCCHQESPSPVRQQVPFESFTGQDPHQVQRNGWGAAEGGIRQPNFYRDPPPMDYSFDVDDAAFDNLLQEEQELRNHSNKRDEIPYEIEEDYGASDDDDMLEFVEEVERHSLPEQRPSKHTRPVLSESSDTTPEPPMRSRAKATKNMYSHVYPEGTDLVKYPWFTDVKRALKERFKLNGFRYHQLDAINATLGGKDAFVLMPTGGGKSLCYQLPAIVQSGKTKGLTIVISPLLSLMNDQVQHLRKINIRAATLNSEVTGDVRTEIMNNLGEQHPEQFIELLYITPEMITKSTNIQNVLSRLHRNKKLARIVIDEAHCVSQWGHDFRPDYVALGQVRERYPNVPLMALTATATENVKVDVMHNLGMGKCPIFAQSFNRPNLNYEVRSKKGKGKAKEILQDIADLVKKKYKNQSGIIYTLSRKGCEQMAEKLKNEHGIKAHHYHASMRPDEKAAVQKNWQSGRIQVVVATIAFGMGIDKADVRFVIHHTIPKSLEGYYQETGRAGRDGKKSGCYLYYGYQDTAVLKDFIYESDASPEQKERQRKMLSRMVQYCENRADCRRVQVLAYFGETFAKEDCEHSCDNCSSDTVFESIDFTTQAQAAMRIVKQAQKDEVTLLHCVDILRGQSTTKIKRFGHEKLQEFGVASNMARSEVERLFFRLLMENALAEHNVINKGGFASQYINVRNSSLSSSHALTIYSLVRIAAVSCLEVANSSYWSKYLLPLGQERNKNNKILRRN